MTITKAELKTLLAVDEPITLKELSRRLGLSKGRLSTLLRSLEKKGLVELEGKKPVVVRPARNKAIELLNAIFRSRSGP